MTSSGKFLQFLNAFFNFWTVTKYLENSPSIYGISRTGNSNMKRKPESEISYSSVPFCGGKKHCLSFCYTSDYTFWWPHCSFTIIVRINPRKNGVHFLESGRPRIELLVGVFVAKYRTLCIQLVCLFLVAPVKFEFLLFIAISPAHNNKRRATRTARKTIQKRHGRV